VHGMTYIQGVPEVLERFCEAISQEPLGLHKRHGCQKMRLIIKFIWEFKNINYLNCPKSYGRFTKQSFFGFFHV
jgi:hypothetical protein